MNNKEKFQNMVDNYYNGNLSDFKKSVKSLSKLNLIKFLQYCNHYDFKIDVYEIEKYL